MWVAGGGQRRDPDPAGALPRGLQCLAGEHPGLVHQPAAVVGPPHARLVRPSEHGPTSSLAPCTVIGDRGDVSMTAALPLMLPLLFACRIIKYTHFACKGPIPSRSKAGAATMLRCCSEAGPSGIVLASCAGGCSQTKQLLLRPQTAAAGITWWPAARTRPCSLLRRGAGTACPLVVCSSNNSFSHVHSLLGWGKALHAI